MSKRIVFLIYTMFPSGGLKVLFRVANGLKQRGYDVSFMIAEDKGAYSLEFDSNFPLTYSERKIPYRLFSRLNYLLRVKVDADIVVATYFPTAIASFLNPKIKGQKLYYVQAYEPHFFSFRFITFLRRFHYYILAKCSYFLPFKFIVNCEGSSIGISPKRIVDVITPGIDLEIYLPKQFKSNKKLTIGHIGRAERRKGSLEFFKAIFELRKMGVEIDLIVAYDKWKDTLGLDYEAVSPKSEMELANFYQRCDIVVSTVWEKGFAYPPLETMACGSISISTPIDYGKPWVHFVPIDVNSPESIVKAIKWCINNPDQAETIRINGLSLANEFSWNNIISKWEGVIVE